MRYLIDTGIWLRLFDRDDPQHAVIRDSLRLLRTSGHTLAACPQNIAEFWNVSTRPSTVRGGYGKSVDTTELRTRFIERHATILDESPAAYREWRNILMQYRIQGLAAHDARLVSVMRVAKMDAILTLNAADFHRYSDILVVTPNLVLNPPA
jgi:predicted nucleic acid-binding protein